MKKAFVFLFCISLIAAQIRRTDRGTVVVVYDGDTIKVKFENGIERRVRLIGIDSAEMEDTPLETPLEALLAKRFTFHHLFRKSVKLTYENDLEDKYGRLLAYVWTDVGLFNEYILKEGFAHVFLKFPYAMKEKFIQAQNKAQELGRGLWQEKPYPFVSLQEVRGYIGKLMRVSFVCARLQKRGDFLFIYPGTEDLAVLIPKEYAIFFNDIQRIKGKAIEVFGFLEEYRGQPQVVVFFPSQLRIRY